MSNLDFQPFDWNGPIKVITPDIENDIKTYLGENALDKWTNTINSDLKEKIIFITERLDMIAHLKSIAMIIRRKSKITKTLINGDLYQVHYECNFQSHNYGGLQFDIEALSYYLYLSCIDAIQSQPQYKSVFEWLKENTERYENKAKSELLDLLKKDDIKYRDEYGLSKNFIKAFVEDISNELKIKICDVLIVVKAENNIINPKSYDTWRQKDGDKKLKKIAEKLYSLRSLYTHKNIRSFLPVTDISTIPDMNGEILLCKKCNPMELLLEDIIKELCLKKLMESNEK